MPEATRALNDTFSEAMIMDSETRRRNGLRGRARRLLHSVGIDRPVGYMLLGRLWSALAAPITILLIGTLLTKEEQGYYYTFSSLLALSAFFDLGLGTVLIQFSSHEKARLQWTAGGLLAGDPEAKSRLGSLVRKAVLWYGVAGLLMLFVVGPAGYLFFSTRCTEDATVVWQIPWCLLVFFASAGLLLNPLFAILEGCGLIHEIYLLRLVQGVANAIVGWTALFLGFSLYTAPALLAGGICVSAAWLAMKYGRGLRDLSRRRRPGASLAWWCELWPMQWKIALTVMSSYFIFQLFNPILFTYFGPVEAGRMGFSLNVASAIWTVALSWVYTKLAVFGVLVAKGAYRQRDRIFFRSLSQSLAVATIGEFALWIAAILLQQLGHRIGDRLLSPGPLLFVVLTNVVNIAVFAEAAYLRAHKEEPFLVVSLVGGLLQGLNAFVIGRAYGALGMTAGNFFLTLVVGLGGGTWIFLRKRRQWRAEGLFAQEGTP
jgi:hypothetical protein